MSAEDDALLDQQDLLSHLLSDACVMLWLFRVRDTLGELLTARGLSPRAVGPSDRLQAQAAARTWYWQLSSAASQQPLVVSLSLATGTEGFVELQLGLALAEAVDSPWSALEALQLCVVPLASARAQPDWMSPGYAAVRLRAALNKASVRSATRALEGELLARAVRPWLDPALAQLLGVLDP